ncbi:multicopper oxidase domain-containing protein [Virgibacillus soli]|uniref:Multicopper oxidase domain-containing protein n=1 Tax=Paracerasibacillus soli TaxID=480284 RepID=A0ABU5CUY2_9BACI|nr:multicopper oxidase domain-containing protein [Virgibacillus soli]MDY0410178.1 multicopper oxidase domain-containing protein [Virgibacillus soli]
MRKRYIYLTIVAIVLVCVFFLVKYIFLNDKSSSESHDLSELVESKPLPIPPLLEDVDPNPDRAEFHLTAQKGTSEILDGIDSETLGYNGDILGPVIRVRKGETVNVKMKNSLDEATTLHWHGLRVDGKYDGGPHSGIKAGETWEPNLQLINQLQHFGITHT